MTAEQIHVDAQRLAEQPFGDHMPANTVLLGGAYRIGVLPVRAEALEETTRLDGAAWTTPSRPSAAAVPLFRPRP